MVTTLPRVHVVITGIEKIVPTLDDFATLMRLLPRSATGQAISNYVSLFTGTRGAGESEGPEKTVFILVDNGRAALAGSDFADMLRCIRCGACMNHCPVYFSLGGHAYGWVYPGPMGSVLTPLYTGIENALDLPHASTGCNQCGGRVPGQYSPAAADAPPARNPERTRACARGANAWRCAPGAGWPGARPCIAGSPGGPRATCAGWPTTAGASASSVWRRAGAPGATCRRRRAGLFTNFTQQEREPEHGICTRRPQGHPAVDQWPRLPDRHRVVLRRRQSGRPARPCGGCRCAARTRRLTAVTAARARAARLGGAGAGQRGRRCSRRWPPALDRYTGHFAETAARGNRLRRSRRRSLKWRRRSRPCAAVPPARPAWSPSSSMPRARSPDLPRPWRRPARRGDAWSSSRARRRRRRCSPCAN